MATSNNIKENIKKIVYLALNRSSKVLVFKDLEYDLEMSKIEIVDILDLFTKAKLFYYEIVPLENNDENYDLGSIKRRHEFRTGRFKIYFNPETGKIYSLMKRLYTPTGSNVPNGITNLKVEAEIEKITEERNAFNESQKGKKRKEFLKKELQSLLDSPKKLNEFLKKYAKYIKLPITNEDSKLTIHKLSINLDTGSYVYNKNKKGVFSPKNQEYKFLHTLIKSPDYQASYGEILKKVSPSIIDPESKSNRDILYTIVKEIKKEFGILPESKKSNPDFIKNLKKFGYRLITK